MLYVQWRESKIKKYRLLVALQNQKGVLAKLLTKISKMNLNVLGIEMGIKSGDSAEYCKIDLESEKLDKDAILKELSDSFKVVEITSLDDAYNK